MEYSNLRVPAMVNRLSNNTSGSNERPPLPKLSYHSNELHTHNNNQPFSYTRTSTTSGISPERPNNVNVNRYSTLDRRLLKSPKEVIYAQVVVDSDGPNDGTGTGTGRNGLHKRTIHTTFNGNGHTHAHSHTEPRYTHRHLTSTPSDPNSEVIEHFVYKRSSNKENLRDGQSYGHETKPKNVTTVLINNNDDEYHDIKSAATRTNELFSSYHRSSSPERGGYFYGANQQNSNSSSSPPYYQFDSSRSVSPMIPPRTKNDVRSAKLVRDADRNRDTFVSSSKLVNTFGPYTGGSHQTHTDYNYMTSKLGEVRKTDERMNSNDYRRGVRGQEQQSHSHLHLYNQKLAAEREEDVVDMKLLTSANSSVEKTNRYNKSRSPPKNGFSNHTNSLEKIYNNKNTTTVTETKKVDKKSEKGSNSGGGIISTLLRRNKDKKNHQENKEKKSASEIVTKEEDKEKEGKIKRQRAKFLSVFLEKNFTSKKNNAEKAGAEKNRMTSSDDFHSNKYMANNKLITDSEIEEVERRRDGEYHSWSSGDDFYRFQGKDGQLNRGHSYNFGDYKKESEISAYDQNDSDYRRNLATTQRYTSATLGRPSGHPAKTDNYNDSIAFRSKSLDRRALRNKYGHNDSVPQIIVTPNSPPIQTTDKWNSSYEIRKQQEPEWPRKEFSKSTYELGDQHQHSQQNGNLRYFGDTDIEDGGNYGRSYNTSTLNSRPSTKLRGSTHSQYTQNGYNNQRVSGGRHVSRKDNSQLRFQKGPMTRNSSESDNERSASSQRSVYLHAPAVASIPTTLPKRTLSRDEISNYSGHQKQTKHLARSMSVLSPWRPRHYQEKYELNYNANGVRTDGVSRPPRLPRSPIQKSISPAPPDREMNKGFSKNKQSNIDKSSKNSSNISRSKSMPKNSRLGWFSRRRNANNGAGDSGTLK